MTTEVMEVMLAVVVVLLTVLVMMMVVVVMVMMELGVTVLVIVVLTTYSKYTAHICSRSQNSISEGPLYTYMN